MSLETSISRISERALSALNFRAGNGVSLTATEDGSPLLTRHQEQSFTTGLTGYPRHGLPTPRLNHFLLNMVPVRGESADLERAVPMVNAKLYIKMTLDPVPFFTGAINDIAYADVVSLEVMLLPHGWVPDRENATVSTSTGAVTRGEYYFFYATLFSDGTARGFGSSTEQEDLDYPYTRITETGWLLSPIGVHYPPIDLIP